MQKVLPYLLVIFLVSVQAQDFAFYAFASIWTGSICTLEECYEHGLDDFWNIHGLWPSDGHVGLAYCSNEPFDPTQIVDLKPELQKYWNGLYSVDDAFHSHEWARHGTCSGMDIHTFFSTVLSLAQRLDIYGNLARGGIVPGSSYDCEHIAQVLTKAYGISNYIVSAPTGYLTQIMLCINDNLELQDCPYSENCNGTVLYPSW